MSAPTGLTIVGAGLSGLIAAHMIPYATVLEREPAPANAHKALLRFRSDVVSQVTGILFRKVTVHKGVWSDDRQLPVMTHRAANLYAQKVAVGLGITATRSVWDLRSVERWVAPSDFYARLVRAVSSRIQWGTDAAGVTDMMNGSLDRVISTAPLHESAALCLPDITLPAFNYACITVGRWRVPGADLHQTLYFPDPDTSMYRASITGDTLIVECMGAELPDVMCEARDQALVALGLDSLSVEEISLSSQRHGKIFPIDEAVRRELLHQMTLRCGVYSLGRFGTWRNILLDDVVQDVRVILGMMQQQDAYSARLRA